MGASILYQMISEMKEGLQMKTRAGEMEGLVVERRTIHGFTVLFMVVLNDGIGSSRERWGVVCAIGRLFVSSRDPIQGHARP